MGEDLGLQRAILASIQSTSSSNFASRNVSSYVPRSTSFATSRNTFTRDIAPTLPDHRRTLARQASWGESSSRTSVGRRDTLQREGIVPISSSQPRSSRATSTAAGSTVIVRRSSESPVRRSNAAAVVSSSTAEGNYRKADIADRGFTNTSSSSSSTTTTTMNAKGIIGGHCSDSSFQEDTSETSSSHPFKERQKSIPGWVEREPVTAEDRSQTSLAAQNPSASHFLLEASTTCTTPYLITFEGTSGGSESQDIIKKFAYTVEVTVKIMSRDSHFFFIVIDYKPSKGHEPGTFLAVSFNVRDHLCRLDRYAHGRQVATFAECQDHSLKANTWFTLKLISRANGNRLTLYNGEQVVFKDLDVSEATSTTSKGSVGLGIFRGKVAVKDWSLQVGDVTANSGSSSSSISRNVGSVRSSTVGSLIAKATAGAVSNRGGKSGPPSEDSWEHLEAIIQRDVMTRTTGVTWESVAALEDAKRLLNEAVVLPLVIPQFFTGIRQPWKGILLYGPPGTGKTMLAKAVANSANTTFFNCSASTLVSKYHGESEKLVKVLFQMARKSAPSTIFLDEIDALMMSRGSSNEHEASRRLKSEILTQIDGIDTVGADVGGLVMVLATTNKPWDLDDALRRRLEKRIYIALPDPPAREQMFQLNLKEVPVSADVNICQLAEVTEGYSGSDIYQICKDGSMAPLRRLASSQSPSEIKAMSDAGLLNNLVVTMEDLVGAIRRIRPSVGTQELAKYEKFKEQFGSL